jgi:fucose 4-O-acetylase-like acetyltransferase
MSGSDAPVENPCRTSYLDVAKGLAILRVIGAHVSRHFESGIAGIDRALFAGQFGVQ